MGVGGDSHVFVCVCGVCVVFMVRLQSRPTYSRVTLINLSATVDLKRNSLPPMYCFHHYVCPLVPHGQYNAHMK